MHDGYVSVSVIAISHTTHSAHDVFEAAELGAKASNVNVDSALVGDIEIIFAPECLDDFFTADGLTLVNNQELEKFKFFEGQRRCLVVNQHALARNVDHNTTVTIRWLKVFFWGVFRHGGRLLQSEANQVHLATS